GLRQLGDCRHLPQQTKSVETPLLNRSRRPRELGRPADLAFDFLDEPRDLAGRGVSLLTLNANERRLVFLIREPDFESAVGDQCHAHHSNEQCHILAEQRSAELAPPEPIRPLGGAVLRGRVTTLRPPEDCREPSKAIVRVYLHSTTLSAIASSFGGIMGSSAR